MHLEPVECGVLENVRGYTLPIIQIRAAGLSIVNYSNLALSINFHPDLAIFISPAIALKSDKVSSDSTFDLDLPDSRGLVPTLTPPIVPHNFCSIVWAIVLPKAQIESVIGTLKGRLGEWTHERIET